MLTRESIDNVVYDAHFPNSGSSASGNITKPSWVSGLGDVGRQAYRDLDEMYGLHKFEPEVLLGKKIELFYVHRDDVLGLPDVPVVIHQIEDGWLQVREERVEGPILVAAGVWSNRLVEMPPIDPITGVSFIFRKPEGYTAKFNVWAPYKQAISYADGGHVWFGDGQAIKNKNWSLDRVQKALGHAKEHGLEDLPLEEHVGYRPYVKGYKNGYFKRVAHKVWVSTGGGKNGIVLAAVQARQFLEELKANGYC